MGTLNNFEIDDIMRNEKGYIGTLLNNELPKDLSALRSWKTKFYSAIVNLQDAPTASERKELNAQGKVPGSHWVCFYNDPKSDSVEYFDSFGLPPTQEMLKFLRSSKKNVVMNNTQYQELDSNACGWFAMYYIKKRNHGYDPYRVLYNFDQRPDERNELIIKDTDETEGDGLVSNLVNTIVSKSPIEFHVPGYQFLGPATKFKEREARGERGINQLDNAAYHHDKVYNQYGPGIERAQADLRLKQKASEIANDNNAGRIERLLAKYLIPLTMNTMYKGNMEAGQNSNQLAM